MAIPTSTTDGTSLEQDVRARRLWYHNIELDTGLRTRFPEDYELNPVLRRVDEGNARLQARLAEHLPADLRGLRVLDLGCADGLFTFWAARRGAEHVLGIERNRRNYERAAWLKTVLDPGNVELRWGSIESRCPADPFDIVLFPGLIYHLINPLGTLHMIRTRCARTLILSSAIDLPDGNGEPMARLDRYATGAHGLWSYNVPMVRQLLTTAGFDIRSESIDGDGPGRGYFAVATPGNFPAHHIFADKIDQEFPINVELRRRRVREVWRRLAASADGPIALFGAGTHTPWLRDQVSDIPGVEVACVLDDRIPPGERLADLPVRRPTDVDPEALSAVVISSWHQTPALLDRASQVFGDRVDIVSLDA